MRRRSVRVTILAASFLLATTAFLAVQHVVRAQKTRSIGSAPQTPTPSPSPTGASTRLLFPYVTNQNGFDTGISISNTTMDPFGTPSWAGNCCVNYYGGTITSPDLPPPRQCTNQVITSGGMTTFTLSYGSVGSGGLVATPGFQGYIIAVCNFPFAHGFAMLSDVGAQNIAANIPALVLPSIRTTSYAEQLVQ